MIPDTTQTEEYRYLIITEYGEINSAYDITVSMLEEFENGELTIYDRVTGMTLREWPSSWEVPAEY